MEEKNDNLEQSNEQATADEKLAPQPTESEEESASPKPSESEETADNAEEAEAHKVGKHTVGTVTEDGTVIAAPSVKDAPKPKKKHSAVIAVLSVVTVASLAFGAWTYIDSHPSGVAARVGDSTITEQEVADYINSYRTAYGLSNDANWAAALLQQGSSPNGYRLTTINSIVQNKVVDSACTAKGITVSDDEINDQIDQIKKSYSIEDDESWSNLLTQSSTTEEKLREQIRLNLAEQKLYEQEVPKPDGYDDAKTAADAVKTNDDGTAKKSKEQSILDNYSSLQSQWQEDCNIYLAKLLDAASITIYPMPSGASYDVDMSMATQASSSDSTDSSDNSGSGSSSDEDSSSSDSSNSSESSNS